jgi:Fur family peroxide stress response transcriptional regulator
MKYQRASMLRESGQRLADACRARAIPLTPQRRAVLEAVVVRDDHPTADGIYDEVRRCLPDVSRMTVYRVLELLLDLGIIARVGHIGRAARFDPITQRHHHLACVRCDSLIDLHDPCLNELDLPDARRLGFEVSDYSILFTGICSACKRKSQGSRRRKDAKRKT